ncbi:MAG: hypothetical protein Q7W56_06680 [Candidatus Latescibacteria bacterium]|nr:hypothetical protein [Candidatus Latescibacterota bacterium]
MMPSPPSLDTKENNRNTWACGSKVITRVETTDGARNRVYKRIYCKTWGCSYCGPIRAWSLCQNIAKCAEQHKLDRLMTLTLDPSKVGNQNPYKLIRGTWAKFRVVIRRHTGQKVSFIEVLELQKNGMPHLHVLISHYLDQKWISNRWQRLGGGRIVHIERVVELDRVGYYLGKYLSKDAILGVPRGIRRFSSSRDIHLREKAEPGVWTLLQGTIESAYERHKRNIVTEKTDSNGHVALFAVPGGVDRANAEAANDGPNFGPFTDADVPPEFAGMGFEVIATYTEQENHEEFLRDLLAGFEQGASGGRLLDTGTEETS